MGNKDIPLAGLTTELEIEQFRRDWDALPAINKHTKFAVSSILPDNLKTVVLVRWTDVQRVIQRQASEIRRLKQDMAAMEERP